MSNALPVFQQLPDFHNFNLEQQLPNLQQLCQSYEAWLAQQLAAPNPSWQSLVAPWHQWQDSLELAFSPLSHLAQVQDSPEVRKAYGQALALITEFHNRLGQNRELFQALQAVAEQPDLTPEQQRSLAKHLHDFVEAGVGLEEPERSEFAANQQRLAELARRFSEQVLDATQAFRLHLTQAQALAGLPESMLAMLADNAAEQKLDGYLLTLEMPSYLAVMQYADDRALRQQLYQAYVTRASEQGPNAEQFDNGPLMLELLQLRQRQAQLLGYANYAQLALSDRMAADEQQVLDFLRGLVAKARPQGQKEVAELARFAQSLGIDELQPWDLAYVSEKLKDQLFAITDEQTRPYFPVETVLKGLFTTLERLFAIEVTAEPYQAYDPEVRLYAIRRQQQPVAYFVLDLYARQGKRSGAWMDAFASRVEQAKGLRLPVAYLVCNSAKPSGDKPGLMTHDDVVTLFHEFGHGLHHMLTEQSIGNISGINGVPWDAVELPSQFMENFCWQPEVLSYLSAHYQTGEPMPQSMLDALLASKNFQSAMQMLRQLEFALFDFELHRLSWDASSSLAQVLRLADQVRAEVAVTPQYALNRFANSFGHIFAGGYAAGYYSYKWAELLSSDAFSRFEEEGLFAIDAAHDFQHFILAAGGSRPAAELYAAFRGRAPKQEALLRHSGIQPS